MFSTIRVRLWLSYAALIAVALLIVSAVLGIFLIRNPYTYRQTTARVVAAQNLLVRDPRGLERTEVISSALDVRVLIFAANGTVLSDTRGAEASLRVSPTADPSRTVRPVRDERGAVWLATMARLSDGNWLVIAAPRPRILPAIEVLRDELWRPMLQGAAVALLLALGMAYLLAGWIEAPLQRLVRAARGIAAGGLAWPASKDPLRVSESGPTEVRELTRAFNAMLNRVSESDKAQKAFVSNVSHELKTPLTSIQGFAQAIRDGTADTDDKRREAAEVIHSEAGRMHRLAVDLLDLAGLDAGTMPLRRAPVNLGLLLEDVRTRLQPLADSAGLTLEVDVDSDLPSIPGDADRLTQVFTNITDNALKFTPRGGSIRVRAVRDATEVRVAVADSGTGIAQEDIDHIFERFYQADSARGGGENHGAGLGLALAREIIAAHGGRISVRSDLGQGAEFVVHLPLLDGSREKRGAA